LIAHSGLLCADLDDLGERLEEVRAKLLASPHLWALFLSPTGNGLKAVFRVANDAAKHYASYLAAQTYVEKLTSVRIDESCKDVGRLCFMSFDPGAYLNVDAVELPPLAEEQRSHDQRSGEAGNNTSEPEIDLRWRIATELLGPIQRTGDTQGYCVCPGRH